VIVTDHERKYCSPHENQKETLVAKISLREPPFSPLAEAVAAPCYAHLHEKSARRLKFYLNRWIILGTHFFFGYDIGKYSFLQ
jgi:hypothetical protein